MATGFLGAAASCWPTQLEAVASICAELGCTSVTYTAPTYTLNFGSGFGATARPVATLTCELIEPPTAASAQAATFDADPGAQAVVAVGVVLAFAAGYLAGVTR